MKRTMIKANSVTSRVEADGAWASSGWRVRQANDEQRQHHPVEQDGQRFEPMQDERPGEEEPEADDQDERRGPQPLVKQPAGLGGELRPAGLDDPHRRDEGAGRPRAFRARAGRWVLLGRGFEVGHEN